LLLSQTHLQQPVAHLAMDIVVHQVSAPDIPRHLILQPVALELLLKLLLQPLSAIFCLLCCCLLPRQQLVMIQLLLGFGLFLLRRRPLFIASCLQPQSSVEIRT